MPAARMWWQAALQCTVHGALFVQVLERATRHAATSLMSVVGVLQATNRLPMPAAPVQAL